MSVEWVKKIAKIFGSIYDFFSKLAKTAIFFAALLFLYQYWPYVDWSRTGSELVEKKTFVQLQDPNASRAIQPLPSTASSSDIVQKEAVLPQPVTEPSESMNKSVPEKEGSKAKPSTKPKKPITNRPPINDRSEVPQTDQSIVSTPNQGVPKPDYLSILQYGQLIFTVDKPYDASGAEIEFEKLLLKGKPDYSHPFIYAGNEISITSIREYIGLLISGGAVEGPVLRGVHGNIIRRAANQAL